MKKLFIFIIFNLLILPIINSHAQNTASLYGVNINVPINFEPVKTNSKKFFLWERMAYGESEHEAKAILDKMFRDVNFSDDNEVMFLGDKNFVSLFSKHKDAKNYTSWNSIFESKVMGACDNKTTEKSMIKCLVEKMGGNLSFTLNVSDIKIPFTDEEINEFNNLKKSEMKKIFNDSLKVSQVTGLKRKIKKFSIVYDNNENIALLFDLKIKSGPITSTNRSIISFTNDSVVLVQMNCIKKASCDLGKSIFPNIVKPIIELNSNQEISIKNGSINQKDLEKLIGVVKTGYRIRSMSKLLFLLL
jgi:hypothetical protein